MLQKPKKTPQKTDIYACIHRKNVSAFLNKRYYRNMQNAREYITVLVKWWTTYGWRHYVPSSSVRCTPFWSENNDVPSWSLVFSSSIFLLLCFSEIMKNDIEWKLKKYLLYISWSRATDNFIENALSILSLCHNWSCVIGQS